MKLTRMVLALAATLALAGCGGADGGGGEGAVADKRVSFQFFGDAEEAKVYGEVAAAYERKTGVKVDLVAVPDRDSHLAKLTTSFAARRPPDVFLLNYRNFGPYDARGVLDPVGPRLAKSKTMQPADYFRSPLEAFTTGGELKCLPQNASSLVVYYNRELFEKAGLDAPAADWTYDDFMAAARKLRDTLRRTDPDTTHAVGLDPGIIRLAPFVWSAGGRLVDDDVKPTRYAFDSPQSREGLDRFLAVHREQLTPSEAAVEAQGLDERFIDGRIGMFFSSRREVPAFRTIKGFDWDVAPFPRAEKRVSVLHSDAFCLAKGSGAEEAWRFAEYAGGPEGQRVLAEGGRIVPSLRSVAESSAFLDPSAKPRSSQVFLDAITGLRRLPNTREWPRIEDAASLAFKRAYYDELSVEAAIARIEAETSGLF